MGIEEKFQFVLSIIAEHNSVIGKGKPGCIDPDKFIGCIKVSGGTNEDRLKRFSYEDILQCIPKIDGIWPVALAKEIATIFRDKGDDDKPRSVSSGRADRLSPSELVQAFDPEEHTNPVGKRLSAMSRGQAFIVFESGRMVDVGATIKLLLEVKQGYDGRKTIKIDGRIKPVYKLGQLPDAYADENPLYVGRPLRPDGVCDQTNRSWEGIPMEVRQMIRLAINEGELKVDIETAHNTLDIALKPDALELLATRYQKAAVKFDTLRRGDCLPKLVVPMGNNIIKDLMSNGRKVL